MLYMEQPGFFESRLHVNISRRMVTKGSDPTLCDKWQWFIKYYGSRSYRGSFGATFSLASTGMILWMRSNGLRCQGSKTLYLDKRDLIVLLLMSFQRLGRPGAPILELPGIQYVLRM
jgi:hypothetical protein